MKLYIRMILLAGMVLNVACSKEASPEKSSQVPTGAVQSADVKQTTDAEEKDPSEIAIGERLFLETRFAQAYAANPAKADPALDYTLTMNDPLPGPFKGKTINCRSCHMVDEHAEHPQAGMRTYADFSHNSPIPARKDGQNMTARNSMSLVNISNKAKHGELFHFDGEFSSMEDLVRATLTRRNYGWLADEAELAKKHVADVIRNDDGKGELAQEFGGSYSKILTGTDPSIAAEFKLPEAYRVNVAQASDQQILDAVAKLIAAYVNDLSFAQDEQGNYTGSPYDQFLLINNLPRQSAENETAAEYANRLLGLVNKLESPKFVVAGSRSYQSHKQEFVFGQKELDGMKLFFTPGSKTTSGGNCISCHAAPDFTDFNFHNTGMSQISYDEVHGIGSFADLDIPDLATRNRDYDKYLMATAEHPAARQPFRALVDVERPGYTDLGTWNILANPDIPAPQEKLRNLFCQRLNSTECTEQQILPLSVATFKTPTVRDLGHSNPYMHNGKFNGLQQVINFYIISSSLAKQNLLVNAAPELQQVNISNESLEPLMAFLMSLNEDYD